MSGRRGWDILLDGETEALDVGNLVEEIRNRLLVDLEGQVADEDGLALRANLIVEFLGAVDRVLVGFGLAAGNVESHVTTIKESTVLLVKRGLCILRSVKINVAKSSGATVVAVGHDASTSDTLALLELLVEDVVIDLPAKVANEESGALGGLVLGLGLLGRGLSIVVGLALLGGDLSLLFGRLGVRLVRVTRSVGVGVLLIVRLRPIVLALSVKWQLS